MPEYRAYLLKDDKITRPPNLIEAETDQAAIEQARQMVDGHDVELWDGPRFVMALKRADAK